MLNTATHDAVYGPMVGESGFSTCLPEGMSGYYSHMCILDRLIHLGINSSVHQSNLFYKQAATQKNLHGEEFKNV